eukprot:scaffold29538_cov120-Isochrysis_galbana.AAC.5
MPNPSDSMPPMASPSLSNPAARPMGFSKTRPHSLVCSTPGSDLFCCGRSPTRPASTPTRWARSGSSIFSAGITTRRYKISAFSSSTSRRKREPPSAAPAAAVAAATRKPTRCIIADECRQGVDPEKGLAAGASAGRMALAGASDQSINQFAMC